VRRRYRRHVQHPVRRQFHGRRAWWKRVLHTATGTYLGTALAFAATVASARGLGPHGFGLLTLAVAVTALIGTILDLTLESAVVHHGYRAREHGDTAALRGLVRTAFVLDLVMGIVVCAAIIGLASFIADFASNGKLDPTLVILAALIALVATVNSTTGAMLLIAGRPDLRGWQATATNSARLLFVIIALATVATPAAVIVAYVCGEAVGAVILAFQAWRVAWRPWTAETHEYKLPVPARELMRFGALSSITGTLNAAWSALIPVVLGRVAGPTTVGDFRVAMFPQFIATNITSPFRLMMLPEQARIAAQGNVDRLRRLVKTQTAIGTVVSIPVMLVLYFALPWLITTLYGNQFAGAVGAARILVITIWGNFAFVWYGTFAGAIGRPGLKTFIEAQELILLGVLLLLLGADGTEGAALAWTIVVAVSSVVTWVSTFWQLNRLERDNEREAALERAAEAGAVPGGDAPKVPAPAA
jgi:O-antigen/teichoic acid export membrane protein